MASHYDVRRAIRVSAPTPVVHALVDHLAEWHRWSPWENGREVTRSFNGPPSGVGATYTWTRSDGRCAGRLRIVRSDPTRIDGELVVDAPTRSHVRITFDLAHVVDDDGVGSTWVTRTLAGRRSTLDQITERIARGGRPGAHDLAAGLARLKAEAEGQAVAA